MAPPLTLSIQVLKCKNLKDESVLSKIDPYVVVSVGDQSKQTAQLNNEDNPVFNETLLFTPGPLFFAGDDKIKIEVWDHNSLTKHQVFGVKEISFGKLMHGITNILLDDPSNGTPAGQCVIDVDKKGAKESYDAYLAFVNSSAGVAEKIAADSKDTVVQEAKDSQEAAEAASKVTAAAMASAIATDITGTAPRGMDSEFGTANVSQNLTGAGPPDKEATEKLAADVGASTAAAVASTSASSAAKAHASVPAAAPRAAPKTTAVNAAGPPPEPLYLGISLRNWGIIFALLLLLYLCVALFYAALLTIAVEARDTEFLKLPSEYFGDFDRENYYTGFGNVIDEKVPLYPWVFMTECPGNTFSSGEPNFDVCTPSCENLIYGDCNNECQKLCVLP
eukprot:CAMPEP_0196580424 /NCGR_PEP_ID=MMETSP1081-20130531/28620_1 /TAXON_ID=36882 /ORGANISM="Pyramimonas amylifera, Strain CCMP720" /LENGTH=391 /DNA_ID=CAMNT_0041900285 /DNA_START=28 /DNA_END=1203 /DNA_ORIENTATION=+